MEIWRGNNLLRVDAPGTEDNIFGYNCIEVDRQFPALGKVAIGLSGFAIVGKPMQLPQGAYTDPELCQIVPSNINYQGASSSLDWIESVLLRKPFRKIIQV